MKKASFLVSAFAIGILILVFPSRSKVKAQHSLFAPGVPTIRHLGVSRPLREIPPTLGVDGQRVVPLFPQPNGPTQGQTDTVVQQTTSAVTSASLLLNLEGVGQGFNGYHVGVAPPDTNGAVGATQYVQWVNLAYAVFDKSTGALDVGPIAGNEIWKTFSTTISNCSLTNDGDVFVRYDAINNRWLLAQLSFSLAPPYEECIAVSQTSDATGAYNLYTLQWSNTLPDYPKWGVWPDAYYFTANLFLPLGGGLYLFAGPEPCALESSQMIQNLDAQLVCFQPGSSYASLLPADLDLGGTSPPAPGEPEFYMSLGSNSLNLWKFHVDWTNTSNSTLTGPASLAVAGFSEACGGGTCIPQGGASQQLDSLADRLMARLAYRNFGGYESLVVNHSVKPGGGSKKHGGSTTPASGVRWYEVRNPGSTPSVFQQGTYAPDTNSRWMGSMAMDKFGDIAVGYSVSSGTMFPAIRYTGRVPADALGTLEGEASIIEGTGSQLPTLSRWGDYSGMSIDPVDGCTFWYTTEYLKASGSFNWNTRIASFRFPGCN
jgi:hypothetical protein